MFLGYAEANVKLLISVPLLILMMLVIINPVYAGNLTKEQLIQREINIYELPIDDRLAIPSPINGSDNITSYDKLQLVAKKQGKTEQELINQLEYFALTMVEYRASILKYQQQLKSIQLLLATVPNNTRLHANMLYIKARLKAYLEKDFDGERQYLFEALSLLDNDNSVAAKIIKLRLLDKYLGVHDHIPGNNTDILLFNIERASILADEINNGYLTSNIKRKIGHVLNNRNRPNQAINYLSEANNFEHIDKFSHLKMLLEKDISASYLHLHLYKKSLQHAFNAKEIILKNEKNHSVYKYIIYSHIADIYESSKNYNQAMDYYLIALNEAELLNRVMWQGLSSLGTAQMYFKMNDLTHALKYTNQSMILFKQLKQERHLMHSYHLQAEIFQVLNNDIKVINASQKALTIAEHYNLHEQQLELLLISIKSKSNTDLNISNDLMKFESVLKLYIDENRNNNDNLYKSENILTIEISNLKKELNFKKQDYQTKKQINDIYLYCAIIFILTLLFILIRYAIKSNKNKQQDITNQSKQHPDIPLNRCLEHINDSPLPKKLTLLAIPELVNFDINLGYIQHNDTHRKILEKLNELSSDIYNIRPGVFVLSSTINQASINDEIDDIINMLNLKCSHSATLTLPIKNDHRLKFPIKNYIDIQYYVMSNFLADKISQHAEIITFSYTPLTIFNSPSKQLIQEAISKGSIKIMVNGRK